MIEAHQRQGRGDAELAVMARLLRRAASTTRDIGAMRTDDGPRLDAIAAKIAQIADEVDRCVTPAQPSTSVDTTFMLQAGVPGED